LGRSGRWRQGEPGRIRSARQRRRGRELTQLLAAAQQRETWRAGLISTLGHDIRAPLATVVSIGQLLAERGDELTPERRDEMIRTILRQARSTLVLADDLLAIALLDEGEFVLRREQTDLGDLIRQSILGYGPEVSVNAPPGLMLVCDPGRIGQVIANLVDNARRHGGPPVEVVAERSEGIVRLTVSDGGSGVPAELAERLFTRFAAGDHPDSVGLGLWISAEMVAAHGGTLRHEDRNGSGTAFVMELPDDRPRPEVAGTPTHA